MFKLFKRSIQKLRSPSIQSVGYVGAVQAAALLIPLVTLPWILHALGPVGYGKYALAIAIGQYAIVLVEFGFDLSAVQQIARIRDDRCALTRYFWTVQSIRLSLALVAGAVAMVVVSTIPKFHPVVGVTAAYLPALLGTVLYPQWLFLGFERIKVASTINIISRLLGIAPLLLFVHTPDDCIRAAFIAAGFLLMCGILSSILIFRWRLVGRFMLPKFRDVKKVFADAWSLFSASLAATLFAALNTVILGLVSASTQVGIYNAAVRVRMAAQIPISAFTPVYMPRIGRILTQGREKAIELTGKLAVVIIALGVCIAITLWFCAEFIVNMLMGAEFGDAIPVLKILAVLPVVTAINSTFCAFALIPFGLGKQLSRIQWIVGLLNVGVVLFLGSRFGAAGAAVSVLICETLLIVLMGFALKRAGLLGGIVASALVQLCLFVGRRRG